LLGAEHPIEVYTDHDNLTKYQHAQKLSQRVAQYLLVIAEYDIQLKHRPGANNRADALSHPPGTDEGSQDNQDVTVLLNHLFCCALQLEDLEQQVWQAQKQHPFQLEE
jgi:hypothetical protein